MTRPLIGLTGRRKSASSIAGFPESLQRLPIDLYLAGYTQAVLAAGGLPIHLPLDLTPDDIGQIAARLDGLLFTGGADIDPTRYRAEPEWQPYDSEPMRDEHEFTLLSVAIDRELPTVCICRGLQLLNVHQGGTLHQHVPAHARYDVGPDTEIHSVQLTTGSILHQLYGPRIDVNTLHHQTIDRLGDQITVTGIAPDGTIEGLELPGKPVVAVQWHPEMMQGSATDPIFGWLIEHAGR